MYSSRMRSFAASFTLATLIVSNTAHAYLDVVAFTGDVAVLGVEFQGDALAFSVNGADQLAFTFPGQSATDSAVRGDAVWMREGATLTLVAGPDFPGVTRLIDFAPDIPSRLASRLFFDDDGTIYLMGTESGNDAIYALHTTDGTHDVVAREGDAAPGGGTYSALDGFQMHAGGPLVFHATASGAAGIFAYEDGAVRRVVSVGDTLLGRTVDLVGEAAADSGGRIYFDATVSDTSGSAGGIFLHDGTSFSQVVAPAPEAADAVESITGFQVAPNAGLFWSGAKWTDAGGGSFIPEPVLVNVATGGSETTLLSAATDLGGNTFEGVIQFAVSNEGVVVDASVADGVGTVEALVSVSIDGTARLHTVVGQVISGLDHSYGALSQLTGISTGRFYVKAFDGTGNDVVDSFAMDTPSPVLKKGGFIDEPETLVADTMGFYRNAGVSWPLTSGGRACLQVTTNDFKSAIACDTDIFATAIDSLVVEGSLTVDTTRASQQLTADASIKVSGTSVAPTWMLEGTFSQPVQGGRIFVVDTLLAEHPELCDFILDGELATGFRCSQTDAAVFGLDSAGLGMDALFDMPSGFTEDTLTVTWNLTGEDEAGQALTSGTDTTTLTNLHMALGLTGADGGTDAGADGGGMGSGGGGICSSAGSLDSTPAHLAVTCLLLFAARRRRR